MTDSNCVQPEVNSTCGDTNTDLEKKINFIDEFYQNTICHVCKNITPDLKRCSRCKLYAYCSVEHQKFHWPFHKIFCKMVENMLNMSPDKKHHIFDLQCIDDVNFEEWKTLRSSIKKIWEKKLDRELTKAENQVWMFPRVCEVCRCSKQAILFDCTICHSATYCSTMHQLKYSPIHDKYCERLKQCYEINLLVFNGLKHPKITAKFDKDVLELPDNIDTFLQECTILNMNDYYSQILASDIISPIITILFALQTADCINNRNVKEKLTIHLVGSALYEENLFWDILCDFFFNWITDLTELTFILIGPETSGTEMSKTYDSQGEVRTTNIFFIQSLYHDYVESELCKIPDMIVGFNCGLHEFENTENDSWARSIKSFFKFTNAALAFTSYTEAEAKLDWTRLLTHTLEGNKLLINCQKNQFASLRPLRDWGTENIPIFYVNNYLSVIKT